MPIGHPVIGRIEGVARGGAGLPKDARTQDRAKERWLFGFGSCLRADGRAATVSRIGGSRAVPIRGGGTRSGGVGPVSFDLDVRPTAGCRAPGPAPRLERIFTPEAQARLFRDYEVVLLGPDSTEDELDAVLPTAFAVVGQPDLPASRLARATALRVLMNVEGNFYPNVDYEACFRAGIHVLGCGPAYAEAVAEFALGLAIDLARGISREDRAFRAGRERYVAAGNDDAILLRRSDIGLVGYGNLGRALHALLRPFDATIRAFDPWLPASTLRDAGLSRRRSTRS